MRQDVRTLLIEDSPTAAASIELQLADSPIHHYVITLIPTFAAARQAIAARAWDLVILDLTLPNGEGMRLVHDVRSLLPSELPLVIITSTERTGEEIESLRLKADEYIPKDQYSHEEFQRLVRKAVFRAQVRRENMPVTEAIRNLTALQQMCEDTPELPPYKTILEPIHECPSAAR